MNKILENIFYAETHEWVEFISDMTVRIGISDFAQQELGDLVFINLPETGDTVTAGIAFGDVESVKAVSDILSPVTGIVSAINEDLLNNPGEINENPYGSWFIEVKDITGKSALMNPVEYGAFCEKEAH
ncbi:MAG: glycine cleavage system protein GcvH [Tannerella sp.]|jgi:glycine cleavage system H protein|nr:glycine cleavage system protein GcvH [Tannerella sp.]